MTNQEIIDQIRISGYPMDLLDPEIAGAIESVLRDLRAAWPLEQYGSFTTVQDQQVYDLFNPVVDSALQQGVLPGGLRVIELVSLGGAGCGDLDVFGITPLLQAASFGSYMIPFNGQAFLPGDYILWDSFWTGYVSRFGTFWFETVESRPGSPIRIAPTPQTDHMLLVRYTRFRTDAQLREDDPSMFLAFVEASCCDVLANKYAATAGMKWEQTQDSGKSLQYWVERGDKFKEEGRCFLDMHKFEHTNPALRS